MSAATKRCQIDDCERAASTKCFCCTRNVCTRHFMEHIEAVKAQIDPLVNDINEMVESIRALTLDKITEPSFAQLQQWRTDMHRQIDEIFLTKTKEMEDLIATNKEKFVEYQKRELESVMEMQDQVRQLVQNGDATLEQIQSLKTQIATVQTNLARFEKGFLSVNTRELVQGLVTVSSNLNRPTSVPPSVTPQPSKPKQVPASHARGSSNSQHLYTHVIYSPTLPMETTTAFPVSSFCGGFQNNAAPLPRPSNRIFNGSRSALTYAFANYPPDSRGSAV